MAEANMPCKQEGKMIDFSHFAPFAIIVCEISEIFRIFATKARTENPSPTEREIP